MQLILRQASISRPSGSWSETDFDVFDGERNVERVYLVDSNAGTETWFWGVSFLLINRKSYGTSNRSMRPRWRSRRSMTHGRRAETTMLKGTDGFKVQPWVAGGETMDREVLDRFVVRFLEIAQRCPDLTSQRDLMRLVNELVDLIEGQKVPEVVGREEHH
jgi:hypothetical protein